MVTRLVAPDKGVSGVDVETSKGTRKYDVAKDGTITVDNARDAAQLKREGFFEAAGASFAHVEAHPCTGCGFQSVFKVYVCPKCEVKNDHRS